MSNEIKIVSVPIETFNRTYEEMEHLTTNLYDLKKELKEIKLDLSGDKKKLVERLEVIEDYYTKIEEIYGKINLSEKSDLILKKIEKSFSQSENKIDKFIENRISQMLQIQNETSEDFVKKSKELELDLKKKIQKIEEEFDDKLKASIEASKDRKDKVFNWLKEINEAVDSRAVESSVKKLLDNQKELKETINEANKIAKTGLKPFLYGIIGGGALILLVQYLNKFFHFIN